MTLRWCDSADANETIQQIQALVENCTEPEERARLQQTSAQESSPADRRPSILQLLRHYPSIKLPLEKLATMLAPLRPRLYSISSSPLVNPSSLKLTWSLITHDPASSLPDEHRTRGLASHYLASLKAGDTLKCLVRRGNPRFKPESHSAPMIMVCAGSGIAPVPGLCRAPRRGARKRPAATTGAPVRRPSQPRACALRVGAGSLAGGRSRRGAVRLLAGRGRGRRRVWYARPGQAMGGP